MQPSKELTHTCNEKLKDQLEINKFILQIILITK